MKIKGLLVIPGEEVQKVKIPSSIKFIQGLIGKNLMRIRLDENTILFLNKNAKKGDFNRVLGNSIINGTFLIVAIKNKHRVSLKKRQQRKYMNKFKLDKHEKRINEYKEQYLLKNMVANLIDNLDYYKYDEIITKKVA